MSKRSARGQPGSSRQRTQRRTTQAINYRQAENMMEAIKFARHMGTPLTAHLTIHWGARTAGDDTDGKRSAKLREGLDKWLQRQGVSGGLIAIWVRERGRDTRSDQNTETTHLHMLMHLPKKYHRQGRPRPKLMQAINRLVARHGDGIVDDRACHLTFPENPDGKYFLKGATLRVWEEFQVPDKWRSRRGEGEIVGKRCGTTQNIGRAARNQYAPGADRIQQLAG